MQEKAKRILKRITAKGEASLAELAKGFQAEAKKLLAAKKGSRSAKAVESQASSLVRNHLRPLVSAGYIKRVGRGQYTVTAKGRKAAAAKTTPKKKAPARKTRTRKAPARKARKAPARKAKKAPARKAKKTPARKAKGARAELAKIRAALKKLSARVDRMAKQI